DSQPCRGTIEVQHITADRVLPPEAQAVCTALAQAVPQEHFRQAEVLPKLAGTRESRPRRAHLPHSAGCAGCDRGASSTAGSGEESPSLAALSDRRTSTLRKAMMSRT